MTGRYVWELSASVWAHDWSIDLWIDGNAEDGAQGGGTWKTVEKHTLVPGKSFPLFKRLRLLGTTGLWKIWKNLFFFPDFSTVWIENMQKIKLLMPQNREIQTNRIKGNSCNFFRTRRFDIRNQHSAPICILTHVLMRLYKTARSRWEVAQIDKSEQGVCISTHPYYWYTLMHRHRHMQSVTHPSPVFTCLYT